MDGYITIGTEIDTSDFDAEITYIESQMQDIEDKLKKADMGFEVGDTQKLEAQYSRLSKQLVKLINKQKELNNTGLFNLQRSIEKVGTSTQKVISKVGRLALAIFGIRSAYNAVRSAASTLSQYNDQIKTDIEYIRYAVASSLQPVIERLIQLVYKLLGYLNYVAKAWFGIDLFANASAKAMEKGSKSAEKMKKSLAGFDEMNVLNDNGTTGAMGALPSVDLSQMQGEVPGWIKWIAENKELILSSLFGIASALSAINFGLQPIKALGLGVAIAGITLAISELLDYLKDPTWENFGGIIQGIGLTILGIGIIVGNMPAIVVGAIVLIFGTIVKYWEEIKGVLQNAIDWLGEKSGFIHKVFGDTIGNIYDHFVRTLQRALDWLDLTFTSVKKILDGIIMFVKGVFTGDWKTAWEGIKKIFGGVWDWIKGTAQLILSGLVDKAIKISSTIGDVVANVFKAVVNGILGAIESILNKPIKNINSLIKIINGIPGIELSTLPTFKLPRLAVGGIVNMPGRGVPVGGAIAGEVSKEGVLPLTDSQAMEELGATIGRYITINANITNTMNGRVISREIKKINANNDFALNR